MVKKDKSRYVCTSCGYETAKWLGRCPECNEWGTFQETLDTSHRKSSKHTSMSRPKPIDLIPLSRETRWVTGIAEFDRTLGGGVVPGTLVLIGGDPGIGKSTMILQALSRFAQSELIPLPFRRGIRTTDKDTG